VCVTVTVSVTVSVCHASHPIPTRLGFAVAVPTDARTGPALPPLVGTKSYSAPESLGIDGASGFAGDMWSLGCILAEAVVGMCIVRDKEEKEEEAHDELWVAMNMELRAALLAQVTARLPADSPLASVITSLLDTDPERRPSASHVLTQLDTDEKL
jgi:serine/threonine protein kinase